MQYLFGDNDVAAQRLKIVAEVFAETTRVFFLESLANGRKLNLCIDLGCGPGYSTHLLTHTLKCERVIGFDNSEYFVSLARKTETEKVSFCLHDVTSVPFPEAPVDLIYCRFLLTHLKDPEEAISKWATQLRPQGLLLIEEVEWIHADNVVFNTYLEIVENLLADKSNWLYVGSVLDGVEDSDILKRRVSQVERLRVADSFAAKMFFLNLQTWKNRPFVRKNYSPMIIKQMEKDLSVLAKKSIGKTETEWGLRQLIFERLKS